MTVLYWRAQYWPQYTDVAWEVPNRKRIVFPDVVAILLLTWLRMLVATYLVVDGA